MIVSIPDPAIGDLRVVGNPVKLSGVPERTDHSAPPDVDGDREAILGLLKKP